MVTAPSAVAAVPFRTNARIPPPTDEPVGPVGPTATPETVISTIPSAPAAPSATVMPRGHRLPTCSDAIRESVPSSTTRHYAPPVRFEPVCGFLPAQFVRRRTFLF